MGIAMGGVMQGVYQGAQLGMQMREEEARRQREQLAQERQAKMDARADEAYQEQQDLKAGVKNAMADVQPTSGLAMVNPNPAVDPAKYDDPSVYNSDVRELRRGGVAPETRPQTMVGNQEVAPGQAPMVAGQQNTDAAKLERVAQVYASKGQMDAALKYKQMAEQARTEGADKFIDSVMGRAPALDALGKGPVLAPIDSTARETFDATGKLKIPEGSQIKYIRQEMPGGGSYVDAQVVDKDGNPLHGGTLKQYQWMMATNPMQRQQVERQGTLDRFGMADKQADNARADRQIRNQEEAQKVNDWATRQRIAIDWQRMASDTEYKNRVLDQYEEGIRGSKANIEAKLKPEHKAVLESIGKQRGKLEEQIKSTQDAITKGLIDGTFQETDENGKPTKAAVAIQRTMKGLESQLGSLAMREADIMRQYEGGGTKDPLGLRAPKGGGDGGSASRSGGERVSREEQAARDKDAVAVLRKEMSDTRDKLAGAKTDEERKRYQADIEALQRELKKAGASDSGGVQKLSDKPEILPGKAGEDPMKKLEPIGAYKPPPGGPMSERENLPLKKGQEAQLPTPLETWAKTQKAAEAARRDDPELKRLQAAVDNAKGRQIHAAKKALDDYLNKKGA